ncbi:MAG: YdiU family protein, partial [Proteobacteria bacterium]
SVLGGNRVTSGMRPYASCYGGHQFGNWAGQLGDGRAITLGEVENTRGDTWEMQLKGAGRTPYSRHADGRAVLRSSLREYVCSEAMFHLGVPTTRALSLVVTGDSIVRDMLYDGHPEEEPGAIVCRVAPSFLRFGSYELFASRGETEPLRTLVRFTLERHYPQYLAADGAMDVPGFFAEVCRRTARLVSEWMRVGFVHGVMNTDNLSILGLTIDYGPYGWIEPFDPGWTPNTTDAGGKRYRFGNQPRIAQWNLAQLGNALLALGGETEPFEAGLEAYAAELSAAQRTTMAEKLGLSVNDACISQDAELVQALMSLLVRTETDMTLFYRALADLPAWGSTHTNDAIFAALREAYYAADGVPSDVIGAIAEWVGLYHERVRAEGVTDAARTARMNAVNPLYVPRNYLVQETIDRVTRGETGALVELCDVLRSPYQKQTGREAFAAKRPEWARHRPGCSMLSCSS